jgi:SepF-like predicted cell division protein (DUF552 family)
MPRLSLFRKPKKQPETEKLSMPPQEETKQEANTPAQEETKQETIAPAQQPAQETVTHALEQKQEATETPSKTYLKAMPLRELSDIENIKNEVKNGNIIILRVTTLASKSIDDVKSAVNELYQFSESIGGDIARLGEERVVICPKSVRIWREKSPTPVSNEPLPTAA